MDSHFSSCFNSCSQGTMGSRALSHESIFLADQVLTDVEPVRILSQENVHSKIKALQVESFGISGISQTSGTAILKPLLRRYHSWSFSSRTYIWGLRLWFCRWNDQKFRKVDARMTVFPTAPAKTQEQILEPHQPLPRWVNQKRKTPQSLYASFQFSGVWRLLSCSFNNLMYHDESKSK